MLSASSYLGMVHARRADLTIIVIECSCPQSRGDCRQRVLRVPRACGQVSICVGSWVCKCRDDALQDGAILAPGIPLQLL
jgi:hypothetical protein